MSFFRPSTGHVGLRILPHSLRLGLGNLSDIRDITINPSMPNTEALILKDKSAVSFYLTPRS